MTGTSEDTTSDHATGDGERPRRRARIETTHGDAETAARIARALAPDNTAEMETVTRDDAVVTTITRDTTGGLQSNVDDYVVNLRTAAQLLAQDGETSTTASPQAGAAGDATRSNGSHNPDT